MASDLAKYVTYDYEDGADPPYYHIYSTDEEPEALAIGATLFTITTPESPEMDEKIIAVCDALQNVIAAATARLEDQHDR
jgi:hypothetical protein